MQILFVPAFSVLVAFLRNTGPLVKLVVVAHPLRTPPVVGVSFFWIAQRVPI